MDIVEPIKHSLLSVGASPVMWLMLASSIASLAVILERAWLLFRGHSEVDALARALSERLRASDIRGVRALLERSRSAQAMIVRAGLDELARGSVAMREAMAGATLLQRVRLERGLNYLGTLASNAPFIGLFGTVIGIILAFEQLSLAGAKGSASGAVMASIAEALVATAVGIGVAVPAVVAFNTFHKRIQVILDQAAAIGHVLLIHAHALREAPSLVAHDGDLRGGATSALAARTLHGDT